MLSTMSDSEKKSLKAAVVGLGKMGLLHACILNVLPNVKLVALCDKGFMIRRISEKLFRDVRIVNALDDLDGLDLDLVYVTTPIPSHFSIVKAIYSEGLVPNVFVEKTLAHNYEGAKELCMLAQESGGVNMVGYMKRFSVTFRKAKNLLDKEALGRVVSFSAYAYSSDFSETKNNSKISVSRGGVLGDLGSHLVDLALWYFGDFRVKLARLSSLDDMGSDDFALFYVDASDGMEGQFEVTWCKKGYRMPEFGLVVYGTKGTMKINDDEVELELKDGKSVKWYRHDLDDNVGFLLGAPEFFREDDYLVKSVLKSVDAKPNFLMASRVDWVIEQVRNKAGKNA